MTARPDGGIDWSLTTWKGSRRQQHRQFYALPFARKLELIQEMAATAAWFSDRQTVAGMVAESPPPFPAPDHDSRPPRGGGDLRQPGEADRR